MTSVRLQWKWFQDVSGRLLRFFCNAIDFKIGYPGVRMERFGAMDIHIPYKISIQRGAMELLEVSLKITENSKCMEVFAKSAEMDFRQKFPKRIRQVYHLVL